MKKTIIILFSVLLTGTGFYGCKKGEGDPFVSTHTRKGRLVNDWVLSAGTSTDINGTTTTIETWSGTSYTATSGSATVVGTGSYDLSIVKDGTWSSTEKTTTTSGTITTIETIVSSGTWNWTAGVGEIKKKSQVVMATLSETTTTTSGTTTTTDIESYTGNTAPQSVWDIYQLKNKELIVKWDGTYLSTSGTFSLSGSSKGEYTFVKK